MPMSPSSLIRRTVSCGKRASRSMASAIGRTSLSAKSRATAWIIACSSLRVTFRLFLQELLEFCCQQWRHFEQVAHDAVVRDLEDRGLGVLVHRADHLRRAHAREMLDGAGDAEAHVELRRDRPTRLADLEAMRTPAGVDRGARRADRAADHLREIFEDHE